jgi:hypothetical protein
MAKRQRNMFVRILLGHALVLSVIIVFFYIGYLDGTQLACVTVVV